MPDYEARCLVLAAENDRLRDHITELKDALGLTFDAPPALMLTPSEGTIFGMLLARGFITKESILTAMYAGRPDGDDRPDPKIVDVYICKLRDKLSPHEITIETKHGEGFFIDRKKSADILKLVPKGEGEKENAEETEREPEPVE
jgi:two-component system cell cycle response regulator CtrA